MAPPSMFKVFIKPKEVVVMFGLLTSFMMLKDGKKPLVKNPNKNIREERYIMFCIGLYITNNIVTPDPMVEINNGNLRLFK